MGCLGIYSFEVGVPLLIYLHYKIIEAKAPPKAKRKNLQCALFIFYYGRPYTFGNNKI